ncbi:MAG: hemerythrin domain-containing protein [Candidatus Nanoarchaeia archaeon]
MSKAMALLSDEHKHILNVIDALLKECSSIDSKGLDKVFFEKAIDFIRNYADKFHHAKEEDILFVELASADMHCDPTKQMLHEHDLGRGFVKGMEEGVKGNDKNKVVENARAYASLLQEHIRKEDMILYPMADDSLSGQALDSMLVKFRQADAERKETEDRCLAFVNEITKPF